MSMQTATHKRKQLFPMFSSENEDARSEPVVTGPSPGVSMPTADVVRVEHLKKDQEKKSLMSIKRAQQEAAEKEEVEEEPKKQSKEDDDTQSMAQAEVDAMLDVEKRQQAAVEKA